MSVTLTWTDTNTQEEGQRVYRDIATMDPANLPTALASLDPDVVTYEDTTAAAGTTYYYRVSAFSGATERVSDEVSITA